ncbi:Hus1-like protein [Venturia nashicola]|uniref:Checkpoint protein n=1 Tax=Venturia nashicola TaxID=86259 RepID=A0A4Z1PER7_9PEZI|nr:Hus1-like protein [Venturia nashicola]
MRFKAQIQNINTFNKFVASLASLGPVAWYGLLAIDTIFDNYTIQSAADNVINLEVPLQSLQRALKSALNATSASIRLTKKDGAPFLCLTITNSSLSSTPYSALAGANQRSNGYDHEDRESTDFSAGSREREVTITQDVPIRVLSVANVEGIHEPRCREPDVHILLPPLMQLKSISDRFTKLALASKSQSSGLNTIGPRLEMAANMHGCLRISIKTDAMNISSAWTGLSNPELDPGQIEGGQDGVANHPSTRMKAKGAADGTGEEGWAKVRIDGRDWGKVMSVGRVGGKVIACFCDDHALILYVYLASEGDDEGSVLTYYVSSYSV